SHGFGNERSRAPAVAAPRTAELDQCGPGHRVHFLALRLDVRILGVHSEAPSNFLILSEPRSKPSRQRRLIAAMGLPERSFASASGWMPQVRQKWCRMRCLLNV